MSSDLHFAWAVGFFEGEGTIHAGSTGPRGSSRSPRRLCLSNTDLETLERFQRAVGVGTIDGPANRAGRKPIYQWRVYRTSEILALLDRMEPLLSSRRRDQSRRLRAATPSDTV